MSHDKLQLPTFPLSEDKSSLPITFTSPDEWSSWESKKKFNTVKQSLDYFKSNSCLLQQISRNLGTDHHFLRREEEQVLDNFQTKFLHSKNYWKKSMGEQWGKKTEQVLSTNQVLYLTCKSYSVLHTKENHVQFKGDKKKSSPRSLPSLPPTHLSQKNSGPSLKSHLNFSLNLITL